MSEQVLPSSHDAHSANNNVQEFVNAFFLLILSVMGATAVSIFSNALEHKALSGE